MVGENSVSVGGRSLSRMKGTLRGLGVGKAKYQAKLIDYKQSQTTIMAEIVKKAHELASYLKKETGETTAIAEKIQLFLANLGGDAMGFETLANTLRTEESQAKNRKEQTREAGDAHLKATATKSVEVFRGTNKRLKQNADQIGNAIKKDEEDLKKVLVLIEYLRMLVKYYYEVDNEIKGYRAREVTFGKKERIRIEHETNDAVSTAGSGGDYDKTLGKKVQAGTSEFQ